MHLNYVSNNYVANYARKKKTQNQFKQTGLSANNSQKWTKKYIVSNYVECWDNFAERDTSLSDRRCKFSPHTFLKTPRKKSVGRFSSFYELLWMEFFRRIGVRVPGYVGHLKLNETTYVAFYINLTICVLGRPYTIRYAGQVRLNRRAGQVDLIACAGKNLPLGRPSVHLTPYENSIR